MKYEDYQRIPQLNSLKSMTTLKRVENILNDWYNLVITEYLQCANGEQRAISERDEQ